MKKLVAGLLCSISLLAGGLAYTAPAQASVVQLGGDPWSPSSASITRLGQCGVSFTLAPNQNTVVKHPNQAGAGYFEVFEVTPSGVHRNVRLVKGAYNGSFYDATNNGIIYGGFYRYWGSGFTTGKAIHLWTNNWPSSLKFRPIC
jgi:hypothetical protein